MTMFGLMTVAEHERLMAELRKERDDEGRLADRMEAERNEIDEQAELFLGTIRRLEAEIAANARYVEIGKRRVEALERAKAKKRKPADEWGPWFDAAGAKPKAVQIHDPIQVLASDGSKIEGMAGGFFWTAGRQYRLRADHPFYKS